MCGWVFSVSSACASTLRWARNVGSSELIAPWSCAGGQKVITRD
jgi:hypothetical protein